MLLYLRRSSVAVPTLPAGNQRPWNDSVRIFPRECRAIRPGLDADPNAGVQHVDRDRVAARRARESRRRRCPDDASESHLARRRRRRQGRQLLLELGSPPPQGARRIALALAEGLCALSALSTCADSLDHISVVVLGSRIDDTMRYVVLASLDYNQITFRALLVPVAWN